MMHERMRRAARCSLICLVALVTARSTSSISGPTGMPRRGPIRPATGGSGACWRRTGQVHAIPRLPGVRSGSAPHARVSRVRRRRSTGCSAWATTWPSTVAQAFVFARICVLVFAHGATRRRRRACAIVAAVVTALSRPLPYFARPGPDRAVDHVRRDGRDAGRAARGPAGSGFAISLSAGVLLSATTLVRPAFVLLPFFFAIAMPLLVAIAALATALARLGPARRHRVADAAAVVHLQLRQPRAVHAVARRRHRPRPVGRRVARRLAGRVQAELTAIAERRTRERRGARRRRSRPKAASTPGRCCNTSTSGATSTTSGTRRTDPIERARARVAADQEYLRAAIAQHPRAIRLGHVQRRLTRGAFVLWAADIPIRYSDINSTPTIVIRVIWLVQGRCCCSPSSASSRWRAAAAGPRRCC